MRPPKHYSQRINNKRKRRLARQAARTTEQNEARILFHGRVLNRGVENWKELFKRLELS